MKSTVKVKIVPAEVEDMLENTYTVYGRLLGMCDNMQASKISKNSEVASKIFTGKTVTISELSEAMEDEYLTNKNFGRPVLTVSAIEKDEKVQNDSKNLFILNEVSLLSQATISKLTMDCKDGSTAIMEVHNEE